ncbi:hypothetical protein ElyMa_005863300 [Elysia marginata]|uniref:Uncharacterized protein n=1 Tax=Elysia marginata TaxID=1093978 RepID=A0AAV4G072_9GAST|nr:hypothetical protein ElyMa_005863300 [Elysia marginata]
MHFFSLSLCFLLFLAKCDGKFPDPRINKRICYQTRERGAAGYRRGHRKDLDMAYYRLAPHANLHHVIPGYTRPETSEDEASTLNEVTWTNDTSSLQFNVRDLSPKFGVSRSRWLVDKLSDVAEETERTISQRQDSAENQEGEEKEDALSTVPSLKEDEVVCKGAKFKELQEGSKDMEENISAEDAKYKSNKRGRRMAWRDVTKSFSHGHQNHHKRRGNKLLKLNANEVNEIVASKKVNIKKKTNITSARSGQQPMMQPDRKTREKDMDGRIQGKKGVHTAGIQGNLSISKHGAHHEMGGQLTHCHEPHTIDPSQQNHCTGNKQNLLYKKQVAGDLGRRRHKRWSPKAERSKEALNSKCMANNAGGGESWDAVAVKADKRVDTKKYFDSRKNPKKVQGSSPKRAPSVTPGNPVHASQSEGWKDMPESGSRPTKLNARPRRSTAVTRPLRRSRIAGVMGCMLTRSSHWKPERCLQFQCGDDLLRKQQQRVGQTEKRFTHQHCTPVSSLSCCSSGGGERQLPGNRSDATLVGKRDSWIWFSHEHKPSLENFASRQRRFHSLDPRVADIAAEIRRQEEMNEDIEREAGSIVATPSVMLEQVHLGATASPRGLASALPSPHPADENIACQVPGDTANDFGGVSRNQKGGNHLSPFQAKLLKTVYGESPKHPARETSPTTKRVPHHFKRQCSQCTSSPPAKERKGSSKKTQAQELRKEESIPGVLLASPVKSSSTSSHKIEEPTRSKMSRKNNTTLLLSSGKKAPSLSPSQFDFFPGRELQDFTFGNRTSNQFQEEPKEAQFDGEMSCASTKASTSSLLDLGPRSNATESCFKGEEDQCSRGEFRTQSHVYSVESPPKTRQGCVMTQDHCESTLSFISDSTKSNSTQKITREVPQKVLTTTSLIAKNRLVLSSTAVNEIQYETCTKESKIKSPQPQSVATSTVESSDSIAKGRLATLRQSVLNNEVTDSVNKILFETTDKNSSSYSPAIKLASPKSISAKTCSKYGIRQALERRQAPPVMSPTSKKSPPCCRGKRRSPNVNVFSPGYYLKKGTPHRPRSSPSSCLSKSQSGLNKSKHACNPRQRSHSFGGQEYVNSEEDNVMKTIRRSTSFLQNSTHDSTCQANLYRCGEKTEIKQNAIPDLDDKKEMTGDTALLDELLNSRQSVSFESDSEKQGGILEIEQPSLLDIESDRQEKIGPDTNISCGINHETELTKLERFITNKALSVSPEFTNQINAHKSFKQPSVLLENKGEKINGLSRKSSFGEKYLDHLECDNNVETSRKNKTLSCEPKEACGVSGCNTQHADTELTLDTNNAEISKETACVREAQQESHALSVHKLALKKDDPNRTPSPDVNKSLSTASRFENTQRLKEKNEGIKQHQDFTEPQGPSNRNKRATFNKIAKGNLKLKNKSVSGRSSQIYLPKKHIPVSALIADISDICTKQQNPTPSPECKAVPVLPFSSQVSVLEKLNKTGIRGVCVDIQEPVNEPESVDKNNPMEQAAQNVSRLRRVRRPNFYGKRQMRITRSVGLVQHVAPVDKTSLSPDKNLVGVDSQIIIKRDGISPKQNSKSVVTSAESRDGDKLHCDLTQQSITGNLGIYKPLKRNSLLLRKMKNNSSPFDLGDLGAQTVGKKEHGYTRLANSDSDLKLETEIPVVSKTAASGSTNNSSNNLPQQRDMISGCQTPTATSYCIDQSQCLALGLQNSQSNLSCNRLTKHHIFSGHVNRVPQGITPSRNIETTIEMTSNSTTKFQQLFYRNNEIFRTLPRTSKSVSGKESGDTCRASSPCFQAIPVGRFTKQQFFCRQNLSSSLRKAHALAKRKEVDQWKSKEALTTITSRNNTSNTKSPLFFIAPSGRKVQRSDSFGVENIRTETLNTTMKKLNTLNVVGRTAEPPTLLFNSVPNCCDITTCELTSNQKSTNADSGFDETTYTSERTRDQTYSLTDKRGQLPPESRALVITNDRDKLLANKEQSMTEPAQEVNPTTMACILKLSEIDEGDDMALKSSSSCLEQDTSSIDTEEVFSPRANSLCDESDNIVEQQQEPLVSLQLPPTRMEAVAYPEPEKPSFHKVQKIHVSQRQDKAESKNNVKNSKRYDVDEQREPQLTASHGSVRMFPAARNTSVETRRTCRKTKSAHVITQNRTLKRQNKLSQSSPSCTNSNGLETFLSNSFPRCNLSETCDEAERERAQHTPDKVPSVLSSPSPSLDCLCVWASSTCLCNGNSLTTSFCNSMISVDSPKRATDELGSDARGSEQTVTEVKTGYVSHLKTNSLSPGFTDSSLASHNSNSAQEDSFSSKGLGSCTKISCAADETGLCHKDKIEEIVEQHYLAELAMHVSLPPTSSDDDDNDEGNEKDAESGQKPQSSRNVLVESSISSSQHEVFPDGKEQIGGATKTFSNRPTNFPGLNQTKPDDPLSSRTILSSDCVIEKCPASHSKFLALSKTGKEEENSGASATAHTKNETRNSSEKPKAKKRRLPGVSGNPGNSLMRAVAHENETCNDTSQTLACSAASKLSPQSTNSARVQSLIPESNSSPNNNNKVASKVPKGIKIDRRSVAFQDLLKRF